MANLSVDILPDYNNWSKDDWINFHKTLKQHFWPDRQRANELWSAAFNNKPIGWTRDSVYTADPYFKSYFSSQGIKFSSNFYSQLDKSLNFLSSLPKTVKIVGIVVVVFGGTLVIFLVSRAIYVAIRNGVALQRSANKGARKILENPEVIAKAII